jgi:hypothetical protein
MAADRSNSLVGRWRARREAARLCRLCRGSRVFHPQLPMACPVCEGTGLRKRPKGSAASDEEHDG